MAFPEDCLARPQLHRDARGSVFEMLRLSEVLEQARGQIFVTTADPGQSKGHHFHTRKTEWFCVIAGEGEMVTLDRSTGSSATIAMTAKTPEVLRIPPTIAHALRNVGSTPLVAVVFVSEVFNPDDPDTFEQRLF